MKALTGLPTEAYIKVSEEAKIQLADLLQLVQQLEKGATPAYLARYRPDICGGLDERGVVRVHSRLKEGLDLADRRISILTAIERRGALTPELRQRLEQTMDRRDLEDLYLPYRPKKRDAADDAFEKGLEPLARFLWAQDKGADIDAEVAKYVNSEKGPATAAAALSGAYAIAARWLSEKPEIRRELRKLFERDGEVVVTSAGGRKKSEKRENLIGYRSKASKISWRQMLSIRRGSRDGALRYTLEVPAEAAAMYLSSCLVTDPESVYTPHLRKIAEAAAAGQLIASLREDVLQRVEDRGDNEAIESFEKGLRKALLAPPAKGLTIVGLETGRPGGWRASVINPAGELIACAVVRPDENAAAKQPDSKTAAEEPKPEAKQAAEEAAPEVAPSNEAPVGADDVSSETVKSAASSSVETAAGDNAQPAEAATESPTAAVEATAGESEEKPVEAAAPVDAEAPVASAAVPPEETSAADATEAPSTAEASAPESAAAATETDQSATDTDSPAEPKSAEAPAAVEAKVSQKPAVAPKKVRREATPVLPLSELLAKHSVDLIVFPNGPGLRQTERFLRAQIRESGRTKIVWKSISDAGTWIYANSKSAKRDMPQYEPAVRSAACLARRVHDPLAEMVKVDPKTLGIGPGYHEVDPKRLRDALQATVERCAHEVGIDLNRAPQELLALAPGLTERLAKRIAEHRAEHGPFTSRDDARKVQGLSDRIYRQAAGFLRVEGDNPLDNTGVHPAFYSLVERLAAAAESDVAGILADPSKLAALNLEEFSGSDQPLARVKSVVNDLKPNRGNVRGEFKLPRAAVELRTADELKLGAKVEGTVANITTFGAFVDIGGDHDGLLHISQIADELIKESKPTIKPGDRVAVFITALEQGGKRISLSMRGPREERKRPPRAAAERTRGAAANGGPRRRRPPNSQGGGRRPAEHRFGPDEKELAREAQRIGGLSIDEKMSMLKDKFRTKT